MNFSKLKTDYPNTFKRFEQWVEQKFETTLAIPNGTVRNEDVVEWLDEQKIMVEVCAIDSWDNWMFKLLGEDCMCPFFEMYISEHEYYSRKEATEAAIEESFKLIENER